MKTGIQISSLKPLLKTPEEVTLAFEKMAALGCRYGQLQWIDPAVPIDHIAAVMRTNAMESLGTQDFYVSVMENLEYYVNLNAATGGIWLTVSRIPDRCKSPEGLDVFAQELTDLRVTAINNLLSENKKALPNGRAFGNQTKLPQVLQHLTALFTIIAAATRFIKLKNDIFARFMMIMESGAFFL